MLGRRTLFNEMTLLATAAVASMVISVVAQAHEHRHTHANLTRAAYRLLDSDFLRSTDHAGLTSQQIEDQITQGVIDEDECFRFDDTGGRDANGMQRDWGNDPNWNSHFYHAKSGKKLDVVVAVGLCVPGTFQQYDAADRAAVLWELAVEDYDDGELWLLAGNRDRAREEFASAFRILGRVMHLLQDMTSPAHTHDDPHGQAAFWDCGGDADDFERWGWCTENGEEGTFHILDYFGDNDIQHDCELDFDSDGTVENYGVPPRGFTCRMWASVSRLYDGQPQGSEVSQYAVRLSPKDNGNVAHAYVRTLANVTFDFTAFQADLKDFVVGNDVQNDSELTSMLRGSGADDCGLTVVDKGLCEGTPGWWIVGDFQDIGRTLGNCGSVERAIGDFREEWWIDGTEGIDCTINEPNVGDYQVLGMAYIENIGGEGANGNGDQGPFIPVRHQKPLFHKLYGTNANREDPIDPIPSQGKSMLRIQGDVLYASAAAYGAGLIEEFIDEVTVAPNANAGGPYEVEACQLVSFDGGASSDANGEIVSYEWDATNDGSYDVSSEQPIYDYVYSEEFDGALRLRVTDNEGFIDEALADVIVSPDVTPPVIESLNASPSHLWPPNKKMVNVRFDVELDDYCEQQCRISGIASNMQETSRSDSTSPDWEITGDLTLMLRSEEWHGNSPANSANVNRVYAVTVECTDTAGNSTSSVLQIAVNPEAPEVAPKNPATDDEENPPIETDGAGPPVTSAQTAVSSGGQAGNSGNSGSGATGLWSLLLLLGALGARRSRIRYTTH